MAVFNAQLDFSNPSVGAASGAAGAAVGISRGILRGLEAFRTNQKFLQDRDLAEREMARKESEMASQSAVRAQQAQGLELANQMANASVPYAGVRAFLETEAKRLENELTKAETAHREALARGEDVKATGLEETIKHLKERITIYQQQARTTAMTAQLNDMATKLYFSMYGVTPQTGAEAPVPDIRLEEPTPSAAPAGTGAAQWHQRGSMAPAPPGAPSLNTIGGFGTVGEPAFGGAGGGEKEKSKQQQDFEKFQGALTGYMESANLIPSKPTGPAAATQSEFTWAQQVAKGLRPFVIGGTTEEETTALEELVKAGKDQGAMYTAVENFLKTDKAYQAGRDVYEKIQYLSNTVAASLIEDFADLERRNIIPGPQTLKDLIYKALDEEMSTYSAEQLLIHIPRTSGALEARIGSLDLAGLNKPEFSALEVEEAWEATFNQPITVNTEKYFSLDELMTWAHHYGSASWTYPLHSKTQRDHPLVKFALHLAHGPDWQTVAYQPSALGAAAAESPTVGFFADKVFPKVFEKAEQAVTQPWRAVRGTALLGLAMEKSSVQAAKDLKAVVDRKMTWSEMTDRQKERDSLIMSRAENFSSQFPYGLENYKRTREGVQAASRFTQRGFSEAMRLLNIKQREDVAKKEKKEAKGK
jgi:hypothetical protein